MEYLNLPNIFQGMKIRHKTYGVGEIYQILHGMVCIGFDKIIRYFKIEELLDKNVFDFKIEQKLDNFKITKIKFVELFGHINSEFAIKDDNCVSILIAPNGCGKTTTFKFLMFVLSPSEELAEEVYRIPFKEFSCFLSNGVTISLLRENIKEGSDLYKERVDSSDDSVAINTKLVYRIIDKNGAIESIIFDDDVLHNELGQSDRFSPENEIFFSTFVNKINQLINGENCRMQIDFIEANRFKKSYIKFLNNISSGGFGIYDESIDKVDILTHINEEFKYNIDVCIKEYNRRLAEAKNKLLFQYIDVPDSKVYDFTMFKNEWDDYCANLDKIYKLGILDYENAIKSFELESAFKKNASFLVTYLEIFKTTIEPLWWFYEKMELFVEIFNKHNAVTKKELKFTQSGIKIYSYGTPIDLDCLSSGEKNDFIMLYRLIFNSSEGGIVLIDEPEISLHIECQEENIDEFIKN